jgi:hypothetical protein
MKQYNFELTKLRALLVCEASIRAMIHYHPYSCLNKRANCAEGPSTCFGCLINFYFQLSEAEAGPDGAHDDFFNVFSGLQIIFHVKPLLHPGPGPSLPKRWHWVSCARASNEAVATKIIMILFFTLWFRLIRKFMHIAKASCTWL